MGLARLIERLRGGRQRGRGHVAVDPRFRYRRCGTCQTLNRVPAGRYHDRAMCGACGKRLPVPGN